MPGPQEIHPTADVEVGAVVGRETKVWHGAHLRAGSAVGDECVIGERVYIDTDVTVGDRVKIQSQAAIYGPAAIADGVFIGPGACLTNDPRPRSVSPDGSAKAASDWSRVGVSVGEGASIGAMATVLSGVAIGAWSMIGAGAVVTHDVGTHELAFGNPARKAGYVCRCGDVLSNSLLCGCGMSYRLENDQLAEP